MCLAFCLIHYLAACILTLFLFFSLLPSASSCPLISGRILPVCPFANLSVDLQVGRDLGPIPGHRPAVAEVVRDPIRPPLPPLFPRGPVPGRRRVPGSVPGHYRQVDPVRDPAVLNRLPVGPTKHPVPPSRRVRPGVAVRDPHKDRLGRPAGSRRPLHGIHVRRDILGCPAVLDRRAPSSHHHQPASCAIRLGLRAPAMDRTTGGRWPFVSAICRCVRRTRA